MVERHTRTAARRFSYAPTSRRVQSVEESISATVRTFGRLNVLFNNAGGSSMRMDLVTEPRWMNLARHQNRSFGHVSLVCRFAIPHIVKAGGGSVINNASVSETGPSGTRRVHRGKGGVIALTPFDGS